MMKSSPTFSKVPKIFPKIFLRCEIFLGSSYELSKTWADVSLYDRGVFRGFASGPSLLEAKNGTKL